MSDLTAELNLALAVGGDDTANYLTGSSGLRGSLNTIDGLFNQSTGHNHSGAHQGGGFSSLTLSGNLSVGGNLSVSGTATFLGALHVPSLVVDTTIAANGAVTFSQSLSVGTTLGVGGQATMVGITASGSVAAAGYVAAGPVLGGAGGDLSANRGNNTGYCWLANTSHYIGFDGTQYQVPTSEMLLNGSWVVTETNTRTLSNKTLNSATLNSPTSNNATITNLTLAGTVNGGPTWSAAQTFPGLTSSGTMTSANGYFISNANNAQLKPSTRAGHPNAEVEVDNYLYVVGDINAGLRMYAISFNTTSDPRQKSNMTIMADDDCMGRIRGAVNVYTYQMAMPPAGTVPEPTATDIGLDATEVHANSPEFTALDESGNAISVSYSNMAALLWGALRQLDARCQAKGI